jgi:peptidoglycan/xylan/chitin deacetylase (PgdA/CDA1 family)
MGYEIIHWSASGQDWLGEDASTIAGHVMQGVVPGRIVLLHDNLEPPPGQGAWRPDQARVRDRRPTADALDDIIRTLRHAGYSFVTITELLRQGAPVRRSWFY